MPTLSKLKTESVQFMIYSLLMGVLMIFPVSGFGKNVIPVETGNYQSASWQFTTELSELWQKQFPEEDSGFAPSYSEDVENRFTNLLSGNSRLVIAPLDGTANQIMLSRPVKMVSLLWSVYLVPIHIGGKKKNISLNNYRYWYVLDHNTIVGELMKILNKPFFEEQLRSRFQEKPLQEEMADNPEKTLAQPVISLTDEDLDPILENPEYENGFESVNLDSEEETPQFQQSAEIAGLGDFSTEVLKVNNSMIPEIVEEYREGILFYEMIGSVKHLKKSFDTPISTIGFEGNIRDFLVSIHPWIQPVYNSRAGIYTLEYSMALYVHADEDPEFVEELLKLLSERQKSYFPPSFIFNNLTIQKSKEISPLFMHVGSLKFFDMD